MPGDASPLKFPKIAPATAEFNWQII
jgi:hypothetical protein